jgi:hypothetical protein
MNRMLADETLTDQDRINNLKGFITVVETCMPMIALSPDDIKECFDLIKAYKDKVIELSV